ncbi:MAG: ABC-2 transporter permease [Erysipelotrichaceae bacterium]|nr:ABC-2 transporter permease [Erysipelotrichaceae bacterium]
MKALLSKDWTVSKGLFKNYLMVMALYALIAYFNDNVFMFNGFCIMIPVMMVINSAAYDEKAHMEKWMIASGITRIQLALSKYLFALVLLCAATLLNFYIAAIVIDIVEALAVSFLFCLVGMTYVSLVLPAVFYFGTEKARISMMVGFLIPFGIGVGITYLFGSLGIQLNELLLLVLVICFCLIVIVASMMISVRIVEKKDY